MEMLKKKTTFVLVVRDIGAVFFFPTTFGLTRDKVTSGELWAVATNGDSH